MRKAVGPRPRIPPPPTAGECRSIRPATHLPPQVSRDPAPHAPRVFAMQYKQELANVTSYGAFRTKIECLIREYVKPRLARGRPNVVAFTEDVGLATIATGSRGQAARDLISTPGGVPGCEGQPPPCGAAAALFAINAAYGRQNAAYQARFPQMGAIEQRVHRAHRHVRARLDAGVLGYGTALRDLHRRLEQPASVSRVERPV